MKMKFSILGILLSLICIIIAIKINYQMSIEYFTVKGKTRAIFAITHLYRLYFGAIGILGLIISLIAIKRKENFWMILIAVSISIISIIMTLMDLWMYMI